MKRIGSAPLTVTAPPIEDDWRQHAACTNKKLALFFPEGGTGADRGQVKKNITERAKRICAGCPVRQMCLDWALETREEFGVWGGLDERERRAILRRTGTVKPRGPGRKLAECGTRKAWERHIRNGEPIDELCAAARYAKPLQGADDDAEVAA